MAQLFHHKISAISWHGQEYTAVDGCINVPDEAVPELKSAFGFVSESDNTSSKARTLVQWKTEELIEEAERLNLDYEGLERKELIALIKEARKNSVGI
jgi:hypothetical protein